MTEVLAAAHHLLGILALVAGAVVALYKLLVRGPLKALHEAMRHHSRVNCVHHRLLFHKLGVEDEEIDEWERRHGVEGGKE